MGRLIQMGQIPQHVVYEPKRPPVFAPPPMKIPELFPFGLPPETLPPPAPGSFSEWLNQEAIGGVKNRYLLFGGGGLILLLAFAGARRR